MKKCKDCKRPIMDDYTYCFSCNKKRNKTIQQANEEDGGPAHAPPSGSGLKGAMEKHAEVLKNINIGVWRVANYMEYMLIKQGEDPKQIRDDMWTKSQDDIAQDKNKLKSLEKARAMRT